MGNSGFYQPQSTRKFQSSQEAVTLIVKVVDVVVVPGDGSSLYPGSMMRYGSPKLAVIVDVHPIILLIA